VRFSLRYIALPFVFALLAAAGAIHNAATPAALRVPIVLDAIAIVSITTLGWPWRDLHSRRWQVRSHGVDDR
jgi:hypothetical protein